MRATNTERTHDEHGTDWSSASPPSRAARWIAATAASESRLSRSDAAFFYKAMDKNNTKPTELMKILAHYCRSVPDWLENEYRVETWVPYGILTVAFVPPPPERDYVPERAFRWVEEDERRRTTEWRLMRDDTRQRYLVLEIGIDDDAMLYHRYYGVPQHVIIASALQLLERNDSDGDGQLL